MRGKDGEEVKLNFSGFDKIEVETLDVHNGARIYSKVLKF